MIDNEQESPEIITDQILQKVVLIFYKVLCDKHLLESSVSVPNDELQSAAEELEELRSIV